MPEGIDIEYDGTYAKMLSYKKANYILEKTDGALVIKGGSFRSRAVEKYCRKFIREAVRCFLNEDLKGFVKLYNTYRENITNRELGIEDFCRKESLRQTPEEYEAKVLEGGPRLAAYEAAKRSPNNPRKGDQVTYYVTGTKKNIRNWEHARLASGMESGNERREHKILSQTPGHGR